MQQPHIYQYHTIRVKDETFFPPDNLVRRENLSRSDRGWIVEHKQAGWRANFGVRTAMMAAMIVRNESLSHWRMRRKL